MYKGFLYLYLREIRRFTKIYGQTLLGPVITALLFLFVFVISFKSRGGAAGSHGIAFVDFLIPGLIMMQVAQNSFGNSSGAILMSKIFGTIADLFMAPLSNIEIVLAYTLATVTRGLMVAVVIFLVTLPFLHNGIYNIFYSLYFVIMGSAFLGIMGIICGLWATTFDKLATITNLVVVPLSFLSGTFYSVDHLPSFVKIIVHFNPVFYMIDGFRYSFIGITDFNVGLEAAILLGLNIILFFGSVLLIKKGYNTRF